MDENHPDIIDYAKPLLDAEIQARACYRALEEDKDLDKAEAAVKAMVKAARKVHQYIEQKRGAQNK